jgi:hypothetical protein
MNTQAIAQHLNLAEELIVEVQEWARVLWVRIKGMRPKFVSKRVAKSVKLSLEEAAKIVDDPEAVQRNYLNQVVLNQAIAMAQELKEADFKSRDGMCVFPNTSQITDKYQDSMKCRQFAICEEIAVFLLSK